MRRILLEDARRKKWEKHSAAYHRVELADSPPSSEPDDRLLALDEGPTRLAIEDPVAARVVELRHFARWGHEGIAATLGFNGVSPSAEIALGRNRPRQKCTYA